MKVKYLIYFNTIPSVLLIMTSLWLTRLTFVVYDWIDFFLISFIHQYLALIQNVEL